jgi:hypothetical protein
VLSPSRKIDFAPSLVTSFSELFRTPMMSSLLWY